MSDRLAEMLSAYLHSDRDAAQRLVLGDYLAEFHGVRYQHILNGRCQHCGGKMRVKGKKDADYGRPFQSDDYAICSVCHEDDPLHSLRTSTSWIMRVVRELGFVLCLSKSHHCHQPATLVDWQSREKYGPPSQEPVSCSKCNNLAIVRRSP